MERWITKKLTSFNGRLFHKRLRKTISKNYHIRLKMRHIIWYNLPYGWRRVYMDKMSHEAIEDYNKWYLNYEEEIWNRSYDTESNLEQVLNEHRLDKLHDLRKMYHIKNASKKRKKELIATLVQQMPAKVQQMIMNFDEERYNLLERAAEKGYVVVPDDFGAYKADYFNQFGILFPTIIDGQKVLILPSELRNAFSKVNREIYYNIAKRNTEVIKLFYGLLHYYGIVDNEQLIAWLKHYYKDITCLEFSKLTLEAAGYYRRCLIIETNYCHYLMENPKEIIVEVLSRSDLKYYQFSKDELIKAGKENYIECNIHEERYMEFLKTHYNLSETEAQRVMVEILFDLRNSICFNDVVNKIANMYDFGDIEVAREQGKLLLELNNNTRMWITKGHTHNEIKKIIGQEHSKVIDIKTRQKIGS